MITSLREEIVDHLVVLSTFNRHFNIGKIKISEERSMNPYSFNMDKMADDGEMKGLIELLTNRVLEIRFMRKSLKRVLVLSYEYVCKTVKRY